MIVRVLTVYLVICILLVYHVRHDVQATLSPGDFAACGGFATAFTDVILYPIDTVKVRQQSSRTPIRISQALSEILRKSGIGGLYKGALAYAGIDGIGAAIFFTSYETAKSKFLEMTSSPLVPYASASVAFALSSSFMVPAELIKVKMQSQSFPSIRACMSTLWKQDGMGIRAFYNGYIATVVRDMPYFALQLGCFDNIRQKLDEIKTQYKGNNKFVLWALDPSRMDLISSLASGTITGILTNPMDVVTARLMTQQTSIPTYIKVTETIAQSSVWESRIGPTMATAVDNAGKSITNAIASSQNVPYKGMVDCIVRMAREEGPGAFFAGVGARVVWIAPFTALSLSLNEAFRRKLIHTRSRRVSRIEKMSGKDD